MSGQVSIAGRLGRIGGVAPAPRATFRSVGIILLVLVSLSSVPAAAASLVADAARQGDLERVRRLLREGADVNAAQGDGMTALHWAAERGDAELTQILLYAGARVTAGTRIGRYLPLHIASRQGHSGIVRLLLTAGSDPDAATTNSGATPLHLAAASGNLDTVMELIRAGADVDRREISWGQTPLMFAAAKGHSSVVGALLTAGADPAIKSISVDTAEWEAADRFAERRIGEILDGFREKEGGSTAWRPTPSQVQAAIAVAREIQRRWPDVPQPGPSRGAASKTESAPGEEGQKAKTESKTAEDQSAEGAESAAQPKKFNAEGQPVDTVIKDPKAKEKDKARPLSYGEMVGGWGGLSSLHHAVRQGHAEAVIALLEGGADIDQPTEGDQTTPLLMAAINGQFDVALVLLERGADPNLASDAGTTPLYGVLERTWAPKASYSHPVEHRHQKATYLEVMEALLKAGAYPNLRLKKHLWFMEYTFGVLRQSGINLKGATPFWRAAYALDVDAMRLLKDYGADPNFATLKPPERRRRRSPAEPKPKTEKAAEEGAAKKPAEKAKKANAEGESAGDEAKDDEEPEVDPSGLPPVPVGGPAIYPIHAASGVGYGQAFAANAHRHVPGNWLAAVKFLVEECGADVNLRDANGYTALHHAASRGDTELVLYLVDQGADVTVVSRKGQTTADMANGPIQRTPPYPETIAVLEKLGSKNNHKCLSC